VAERALGRGARFASAAAGAALGIAGVAALSRGFGFGRTVVFARTVGATCLGDTYVTANTVPNIVFEVVAGGALASMVVPVLAGPVARGDREHASRTASALLSWAMLVAVPVTIVGMVLARPIVGLLIGNGGAGCPRSDELATGTRMLLFFLPQIVFYAISVVLTGVLQAHRRFLGPAAAPLMSSAVVIAAYLVFRGVRSGNSLGDHGIGAQLVLAVGTTLGVVALAGAMVRPVLRLRLRLRPTLRFPEAVGRRVAGLAVAGAVTLAAQQMSTAVVLRLAHRGAGGTLVLYNLAWAVFLVPWSVVSVPVATSAFPRLSARADSGDDEGYADAAGLGLRVLVITTLAAAAALVGAAAPTARVLALGAPGNADSLALAWTVVAFAPGLLGYGIVAYVGRALYARQRWRPAAAAICAGWVVVIGADLALLPSFALRWRVVALGVGNSIGMTVAAVLLLRALRTVTDGVALARLARTGLGALAGAVAGGAAGLGVTVAAGHRSALVSVAVAVAAAAVAVATCLVCAAAVEGATERRRILATFGGRWAAAPDG
jgi:putative peptidoglycan lipid II flippase